MASIPSSSINSQIYIDKGETVYSDTNITLFKPALYFLIDDNKIQIQAAGSFTYTFNGVNYSVQITDVSGNDRPIINLTGNLYSSCEVSFIGSNANDGLNVTYTYNRDYAPGFLSYHNEETGSSWTRTNYNDCILECNKTTAYRTGITKFHSPYKVKISSASSSTITDVKYGLVPEVEPTYTFDRRLSYIPTIKNPEIVYTDAYITLYKWDIYYNFYDHWIKPEYNNDLRKYTYFTFNSGVHTTDPQTNNTVYSQITDTIYFGPNTSTTLNGASFSNYYCEFDFDFDVVTSISILQKDDKNYYRYVTSINYYTVGNTFYAEQVVTIQEGYKTTNTLYYWNVPEEYSRRTLTQYYAGGYTDSYCISINWRSIYNKALSLTPYESSNEEYALSVISLINAYTSYYSAYLIIIPYDPAFITVKESELSASFDKDTWLYTVTPGLKKPILRLYKGSDLIYQRT